jgi:hypothetical protein
MNTQKTFYRVRMAGLLLLAMSPFGPTRILLFAAQMSDFDPFCNIGPDQCLRFVVGNFHMPNGGALP